MTNALMTIGNTNEPTMSSREIAELVESRHEEVKRTVERLMAKGVIEGYAPMAYTHGQNGQQYNEYHIGKRDSYVIVAQLSRVHRSTGGPLAGAGSPGRQAPGSADLRRGSPCGCRSG